MSLEVYGRVAQQVEQQTENLCRVDSISAPATISESGTLLSKHRKKDPQ